MVRKEHGTAASASAAAAAASEEVIYKIDIPANRYDMLCLEGIARALNVFRGVSAPPRYTLADSSAARPQQLIVEKETALIRPFVVAAVLRGMSFDRSSYDSFIDLQDKLHQNLCRQRSLVAIGTHDLDTLKARRAACMPCPCIMPARNTTAAANVARHRSQGCRGRSGLLMLARARLLRHFVYRFSSPLVLQGPFTYRALDPQDITFVPLKQSEPFRADQLLEHYAQNDQKLKKFVPLIRDSKVYPVIYDAAGMVLSLPPVINGAHSAIRLETKNVFIECTATDLTKAKVVLNTVVTMFSECEPSR
jgi:phenylalanyl-tRNA synthetase beta chain